jgi:hypothetical protein
MRGKFVLFVSLALSITVPSIIRADGGTVRCSERRGDLLVTVFTSPAPLCAGPVDVSILLLDAKTGMPQGGVPIIVEAVSVEPQQRRFVRAATSESATNKLMRAADFDLPVGKWHVDVRVGDASKNSPMGFDADVAESLPPWVETGLWIGWPFVAIGLFVAHQMLSRRRSLGPSAT